MGGHGLRSVAHGGHLADGARKQGIVRGQSGQGSAGEGSAAGPAEAVASSASPRVGPPAVRMSYAAAELLPALSHGVRTCAQLRREGGWGVLFAAAGQDGARPLERLLASAMSGAAAALECTVPLLVRHLLEAAGECSGNDGASNNCGSGGGAGTPWRQQLLRDVRLMELLGAGVVLYMRGVFEGWYEDVFSLGAYLKGRLRDGMARVLPLAAAAFPTELRAVMDGGSAAAAAAGGGTDAAGSGPGPEAAGGAHAAGPSTGRSGIPHYVVEEVLEGCHRPEWGTWVQDVLGGGELPGGAVQELTEFHVGSYAAGRESVTALLRALLPPEEARAAVAAAVAAGPARSEA